MASDYSNLNFNGRADIRRWKEKCAEQRKIALKWPAYDPHMENCEEYRWKLGPWSLNLTLGIYRKPYLWHASAAIFEQVAYETVPTERGNIEVPQDALLSRTSWHKEHVEQADFILNEILGDLIRANDNSQQVLIYDGLWCRHLMLKYDGEETWKKNLN